MDRTIKIIEQGNGIDGIRFGSRVYDAAADEVMELTSAPGSLHTDDTRGNYRVATAEIVGDASDLTEAEFNGLPAALIVDVQPALKVGARVSGGAVDTEDYDEGKVLESSGDRCRIGWDSGVQTEVGADELTVL